MVSTQQRSFSYGGLEGVVFYIKIDSLIIIVGQLTLDVMPHLKLTLPKVR